MFRIVDTFKDGSTTVETFSDETRLNLGMVIRDLRMEDPDYGLVMSVAQQVDPLLDDVSWNSVTGWKFLQVSFNHKVKMKA